MTENLLNLLKSQATGAVGNQLGQYLGVGQDQVGSIVEKAGAAMLGGMMQKASTPSGLGDLFNMVQKSGGAGIPDLGSMLGSPQKRDEYIRQGDDVVGGVLGNNLPAIIGALGPILGIAKNLVGPLLSMIGPMLIGMISKQVMGQGKMSANGLMDVLMSQKDHVKASMPTGLGSALGIANLDELGRTATGHAADAARTAANYGTAAVNRGTDAVRTTATNVGHAAEKTGSLFNTLLPLIGLALLALLGLFALRSCAPPEEPPVAPAARTDVDRAPTEIVPARPIDEDRIVDPNAVSPLPAPATTGERIEGAAARTGDAIERAAREAVDATGRAVDASGRVIEDAGDAAGRALENAGDAAGRAVENAGDAAGRALDRSR